MKPGIRYEYRTPKVTVGRRRARGEAIWPVTSNGQFPLYSLTMQQGLLGTSVGFNEISRPPSLGYIHVSIVTKPQGRHLFKHEFVMNTLYL